MITAAPPDTSRSWAPSAATRSRIVVSCGALAGLGVARRSREPSGGGVAVGRAPWWTEEPGVMPIAMVLPRRSPRLGSRLLSSGSTGSTRCDPNSPVSPAGRISSARAAAPLIMRPAIVRPVVHISKLIFKVTRRRGDPVNQVKPLQPAGDRHQGNQHEPIGRPRRQSRAALLGPPQPGPDQAAQSRVPARSGTTRTRPPSPGRTTRSQASAADLAAKSGRAVKPERSPLRSHIVATGSRHRRGLGRGNCLPVVLSLPAAHRRAA